MHKQIDVVSCSYTTSREIISFSYRNEIHLLMIRAQKKIVNESSNILSTFFNKLRNEPSQSESRLIKFELVNFKPNQNRTN